MSGTVERRRFRTWEPDTSARPDQAWKIVFRYGIQRSLRAWWVVLPLVGAAVAIVMMLAGASMSWSLSEPGWGPQHWELIDMAWGLLAIGAAFVFLVGTPLFSEDLRFNAPLFYFSKPLRVRDYVLGKAMHLAVVLVAVVMVPLVLLLILGMVLGPANAVPPEGAVAGQVADWKVETLDTVGDWLFAAAVLLPGVLLILAFATAVTLAVSVHTRRAWHSAMALVAILGGWSLLGSIAGEFTRNATGHLFGPAGWLYLIIAMPLQRHFLPEASHDPVPPGLQHALPAILLAYLIVGALTFLCGALVMHRLRRQEAWM